MNVVKRSAVHVHGNVGLGCYYFYLKNSYTIIHPEVG